jgi:hypothetical protein
VGPTNFSVLLLSVFFPGVKGPRYELYHSPLSTAEVKNELNCNSISTVILHVMEMDGFPLSIYRRGGWGGVVVKALRYQSDGLAIDPRRSRWGFFSKLPTEPYAPGSTQSLKMSTRKTPGGEGGRCVGLTTLPPS